MLKGGESGLPRQARAPIGLLKSELDAAVREGLSEHDLLVFGGRVSGEPKRPQLRQLPQRFAGSDFVGLEAPTHEVVQSCKRLDIGYLIEVES